MSSVVDRTGTVVANFSLTERLWILDIRVDDIGVALRPGQFVHVRVPRMEDHILRRPFSVLEMTPKRDVISILYQVVGFGSKHMTTLHAGEDVDVIGPIGNGWHAPKATSRALVVAGGVGAAPMYMHACELVHAGVDVTVVLGAQTAEALVLEPKYTRLLGHEPYLATDDGSRGHAGFVTDVLDGLLDSESYDYAACCGPEPMMRIVSDKTLAAGIPSFVSMERRMACGIGACLSCVVETASGRRRSCVDGPVFDASEVVWQ